MWLWLLLSCDSSKTDKVKDTSIDEILDYTSSMPLADMECVPGGDFQNIQEETVSSFEYAKMCEPYLGVVPSFDCNDGVVIPVKMNGEVIWEDPGFLQCDDFSLQVGQCIPGSTIQRFVGRTQDGEVLPNVVWVGFCRVQVGGTRFQDQVQFENSIQVIGYDSETGASCFFNGGTFFNIHDGNTPTESVWKAQGVVPTMDNPMFNQVLRVPTGPQCVLCHKSNPFIHNGWIDGATLPNHPDESVLPVVSGADAPFWVVGHNHWDLRTIHIDDNGCLGCHRANTGLLSLSKRHGWDPNNHMPPQEPGSMREDYEQLMRCWEDGPDNTPGCDWIIPPGGECEGGRVDENYPHAADTSLPPI